MFKTWDGLEVPDDQLASSFRMDHDLRISRSAVVVAMLLIAAAAGVACYVAGQERAVIIFACAASWGIAGVGTCLVDYAWVRCGSRFMHGVVAGILFGSFLPPLGAAIGAIVILLGSRLFMTATAIRRFSLMLPELKRDAALLRERIDAGTATPDDQEHLQQLERVIGRRQLAEDAS